MKKKKLVTDSWFKRKQYLHFDYALTKKEAAGYVKHPKNIQKHNFSPFIHYTKTSRRYKRNKITRKIEISKKKRNIFYPSHIDGYVYSYYASILCEKYEEFLKKHDLDQNIIAYRRIEKNGQKYSNINLASEAFDYIKESQGCRILCLDINAFFDNLCLIKIKEKWCQILDVHKLPEDHYRVFKSLKNFHYVEEDDIIENFGVFPRSHNLKLQGGSIKHRICNYKQLREINNSLLDNEKIIRHKSILDVSGIPQGSPISGLLSNIFMIDFDLSLKDFVDSMGGCFRRYSDDIFIALPSSITFKEIESFVSSNIQDYSNNSLKINQQKTEKTIYETGSNGMAICLRDGKPSQVQYLGFTFDGRRIHIRNSSISKNRSKISYEVRKNKKRKGTINTKKVFKSQSRRKITPFNKMTQKGFVYYAERASGIQQAEEIIVQTQKNDKFIKKKIVQVMQA